MATPIMDERSEVHRVSISPCESDLLLVKNRHYVSWRGCVFGATGMIERFAVAEISTHSLTFAQDLAAYVDEDIGGIGIWEFKLGIGPDGEAIDSFLASGLRATLAVPQVWSILPNPVLPEPTEPSDRIDMICSSARRLAAFDPVAIGVQTGGTSGVTRTKARTVIVQGLRQLCRTAAGLHPRGFDIAIEPVHHGLGDEWSAISSLTDAVELIDDVGEPNLKIVLDSWHMADDPELRDGLDRYVRKIALVQVADRKAANGDWRDRTLPGDGMIDFSSLVRALDRLGYRGWFELEISSDDGSGDNEVPGSPPRERPTDVLHRAQTWFRHLYQATSLPNR